MKMRFEISGPTYPLIVDRRAGGTGQAQMRDENSAFSNSWMLSPIHMIGQLGYDRVRVSAFTSGLSYAHPHQRQSLLDEWNGDDDRAAIACQCE